MMRTCLALALLAAAAPVQEDFRLEKGDHVCIVGNTTAERLQHDGWLETLLQNRFPRHELVIRNLGFSADELTVRLRSSGFGAPDKHLAIHKADVILAFFGYNESFAGEAGLEKFRKDLDAFVKHTLAQKYNDKGAPRLILFSPIAHENLRDPNLPDGARNNARLELYARAMAETAKANSVPFVDLYAPTLKLYAAAQRPLTTNGVHLNDEGNRRLAAVIDAALFTGPAPVRASDDLEKLRQAVLDKNFHWFHRYRTTDGYSTYGGRADLKFVAGQTNREVMQRELEILDAMTSNRDRRIWAVAQGGDMKVDDGNTPDFVPVVTNKPGQGPNKEHLFLGGEMEITRMEVAKGMKVNLFASEETFPDLVNPVQMAWDTRGRLWVAAWPTYPHWKPKDPMNDKLLILEDNDGDGKADACKVFAGDLHNPTGFEFWNGGVIVAMAPDLIFLKDTDGDDKADVRERILHGLDSADTHHTSNSFVLDPGGALYFQEGTFHHTQVETPYGPPERCTNAGVFRFEPRTRKFEVYVSYGFANPHGHVFDRWGQDFVTDGTGANTYYALSFSGRTVGYGRKHARPPQVYQQRTRPCAATEILSSSHFPEANQGNLLVSNVIGFQGILQYKIADKGSGFAGTEVEVIVQSPDPNFRPSDIEMGPDGAIYFTDWHNPIIGHMQHNLRDPSRGKTHGRVYRVRHLDRPLVKPAKIAGEPIAKLLDLLKGSDDRVRYRARIELGGRRTDEVIAAARTWTAALDKGDKDYEHHVLEALWLHQNHNVVDAELLKRVLRSPDPRARAAATRVLRYWRDRVPEALALLKVQAGDEHPRVRLEAVVACSNFEEGAAVALECLKRERDAFIDYSLKETMSALEPHWKAALRDGKLEVSSDNPAALDFLLAGVGTTELLKLPRTEAVYTALLTRPGVPAQHRRDALADLAKTRGVGETALLADMLERLAAAGQPVPEDYTRLLTARPADELAKFRARFRVVAEGRYTPQIRPIGYAAWIAADGSGKGAYETAAKAPEGGLRDFLAAVPLVADDRVRESLYELVRTLLSTTEAPAAARGVIVDYFELAPKDVAVETLAALKPKVTGIANEISLRVPQIQRRDAFALRFTATLAVPKDGTYTFTTSSDDGSRLYVDGKLVVNNDGLHGMGEKNGNVKLQAGGHALVVTYFDNGGGDGLEVSWKGPGFDKQPIPAGALGAAAADSIQEAAIQALAAIPGRDREKFDDLAALITSGKNRGSAFGAIRRIDRKHWPAEQARPLINAVLGHAAALPAGERTTPHALDALRFGQDLAGLLPSAEAERARAMLKNLDVNVIVIRPVPHQMIFDRRNFAVEAGKPVEIVFENIDIMPHNLVVTAPGAMAIVGEMAEQMGLQGQEKDYIPATPKVLWATRRVQPGKFEKLQFTAPSTPGRYPYVCTFPGHWLVMNGVMEVVAKGVAPTLAESLHAQAGPSRPFVKMWALRDLEKEAQVPLAGRSFARGKELFAATGCVKCHTIRGEGVNVGPELTKVSERYKGRDLLRQILEPSTEINEQFRTWLIQTTDGDIVTGLVVKEDAAGLHVLANSQTPGELTVIAKEKIVARKAAEISTMPTGLLVTLQKEEILDLAAYVEAGGDPAHKAFK